MIEVKTARPVVPARPAVRRTLRASLSRRVNNSWFKKQWEYETKVRTHIKERVASKLINDGASVWSPAVTR
jgi:hypothetical protein